MSKSGNPTVEDSFSNDPDVNDKAGSSWLFPATMLAWVVIVLLGAWRYQGTPVQPASLSEKCFSAESALKILEDLVGEGIVHPSGSEHNKVVRQKIVDRLTRLGYQVEQHECTGTRRDGEKIPLVNLWTRLPGKNHGTSNEKLVAVVSHYDSNPDSPGASDDGVAVAASLTIARMLQQNLPQLNHDILFLITDGEEMGLLGAREFVEHHPLAKEIDVVINLEARGTSGPSLMFETHPDNSISVRQFVAASPKPFCGSLFYEIYKVLPNDTDFTVFKQADIPGFNFAFIGDVKNYHTRNDSIQNLDMNSMQHHGDNLLSLLLELDRHEKFKPDEDESRFTVYFDVMGWIVFSWPVGWSIALWTISFAGCIGVFLLIRPERKPITLTEKSPPRWVVRFNTSRLVRSVFLVLVMIGASCMALFSVHAGLKSSDALGPGWVNDAVLVELSYWTLSICAIYTCVWLAEQTALESFLWLTVVCLWAVLGLIVILTVPGACYLFIVPLLVTFILSLVPALLYRKSATSWCLLVLAVSIGFLWLPMERMFYDAIGFKLNLLLVVRIAIVTTSIFPIAFATREKRVPLIAMSFAFLGFATSIVSVVWT